MRNLLCHILMFMPLLTVAQVYMNYAHIKALETSSSQWLCSSFEKSNPSAFIFDDCPPQFQEKLPEAISEDWLFSSKLKISEERDLVTLLLREDCSRFLHLKALGDLYFPLIDSLLLANNLPIEYRYLPACLSGFNNEFKFANGRAGIWQLSYLEACKYGLQIDKQTDERFHQEKEFKAAIGKLSELHKKYENPELVIYAWLRGIPETNKLLVQGIQVNDDKELNHLLCYYTLLMRSFRVLVVHDFNKEYTQFLAEYQKIYNPANASKAAYSALVQIEIDDLNRSNPWFITQQIPSNSECGLLLSKVQAARYYIVKDSLYQWEEILRKREAEEAARKQQEELEDRKELTYTVKRGDVLGSIADRHGVSISELKTWNSLRKDMIFIGQKLLIYNDYSSSKQHTDKPESTTGNSVDKEKTSYTVKSGDTLWLIAKKFPGVSADEIMEWNKTDEDIRPGQKLIIYTNK